MDTRAFLEAVWPASGIYCLATPFKTDDMARETYAHHTFNSVNEAVAWVGKNKAKTNIFFAVHTLKEHKVWNEAKRDRQTGELGKWEKRTHENMAESRAFFFDLDIGESTPLTPKYATRQEALDGLEAFLFRNRLPDPLIASSGGGFHVYWRCSEPLSSEDWRRSAATLHHLARRAGLRVDPSRTTDQSSVLRVVGTLNVKPGREARDCVALQAGVETPTEAFVEQLAELLGSDVVVDAPRPSHTRGVGRGNLQPEWDGPQRTLDEVAEVCEHVRNYREQGYSEGGYPVFYALGCGIIPFLEDGDEHFHELAAKHPRYEESYGDEMRERWDEGSDGPSSCANLNAKCGGDACARCPFAKLGKNPLTIATAALKRKALPPPKLSVNLDGVTPQIIAEPGAPYKRTARGITQMVQTKNKDGSTTDEEVLICKYDMFPFEVCDRTELERSFSLWAAELPIVGQRVIKITSAMMADIKQLNLTLIDHGVIVNNNHVERVRNMMLHYQRVLQEKRAASPQYDHLGWADKAHTEFVLPNVVLNVDGTSKPCTMSAAGKEIGKLVSQSGSLEEQIKLMQFYNEPKYLRHQFVILCGLASPLFWATTHYGVTVSCSGEKSGGGKSSALDTAAALWGSPEDYVVNGTKLGSTLLRQQDTVHQLQNLPFCIDEITHHTDQQIIDFVMGCTQNKRRGIMQQNGVAKPVPEGYKSTYYLCTSNRSLHHMLNTNNAAGQAADMRVFEMYFPQITDPDPAVYAGLIAAADRYRHQIRACYGFIGPAFLEIYMKDRAAIDEAVRLLKAKIDARFGLTAPERYWSAAIAAALVAGEIAFKAGLLPYDTSLIREWLINEQIPYMRRVVKDEEQATNPASVVSSFLYDKMANTLIMQRTESGFSHSLHDPHGQVVAELRKEESIIHVRTEAFKAWCVHNHKFPAQVLNDLMRTGGVFAMSTKRTLGAGSHYARGRAYCFSVNLKHPDFASEVEPVASASNVVQLKRKGSNL